MAGGDMLTGHTRLPEPNQNAIRICCRERIRTADRLSPPGTSNQAALPLSYTAMKKPARRITRAQISIISLILIHT